jgi:cell division protein FtsL
MVAKFKKNKKIKSLKDKILSVFLISLVLFIVGFIVVTNWKINRRREELINRVSLLKEEVQKLEEKNRELKEKKLDSESEDYLEKVARDQLDLKKPGEEVVVVQKEEEEKEEEQERKSWWDKFKSIWTRD